MPIRHLFTAALFCLVFPSCANFRHLAADLKLVDQSYLIRGGIENTDELKEPVYAAVVEWDQATGKVSSGDLLQLAPGGNFAFLVKSPLNQHVLAFADMNGNRLLEKGEPFWTYRGPDGKAAPVPLSADRRRASVTGRLSRGEDVAAGLRSGVKQWLAGRKPEEAITRQGVRFSLGEVVKLDDPRFATTRGEDGLWTPATLAIRWGFGLYFLEPYDPAKIPVLFVHGAGGSPQDWRHAMERLDKKRYQAWFYFYPSGARLHLVASALNDAVKQVHGRYRFREVIVVAHSMGGLVARDFITMNVVRDKQTYIRNFITLSTPWAGHEAAGLGVRWAPSVVPSWLDVERGSGYLSGLYEQSLKGKVTHHLFFSRHASRSPVLPAENDGTVSVASQLRPEAVADATTVQGYDETHISILSSNEVLKAAAKRIQGVRRRAEGPPVR